MVDQFTRECVCLEADRAMTGMQVAQALQRAKAERGRLPASITVDNGSEFSSRALEAWVMGQRRTVVSLWSARDPHEIRGIGLLSPASAVHHPAKQTIPRSNTRLAIAR